MGRHRDGNAYHMSTSPIGHFASGQDKPRRLAVTMFSIARKLGVGRTSIGLGAFAGGVGLAKIFGEFPKHVAHRFHFDFQLSHALAQG